MASGIAHDFNNLLTSILGYASLAVTKLKVDDPVREDVFMIISGARQAVGLTSQMLTYAGRKPVEFDLLDINDIVDGFSELSKSRMPGKVDLELNLQRNLPLLSGDSVQLGQVLMILLSNAATAMGHDKGRIEVATGTRDISAEFQKECLFAEDAATGTHLFLRVDDTGVGIEKDQLDLIFDPFYSGKSTGKGLGLASLSGIVRQHDGFVHVKSELGVGSQFSIFFPIASYQNKPTQAEKVSHLFPDQNFKARILVAEEDDRIRGLIQTVMEKAGHDVVATATGQETLDRVSEDTTDFDLLLLDFTMPEVSRCRMIRTLHT
jgi:signal transduction histidine kinase